MNSERMNEWKSLFIEGDSFSRTTNQPCGPHKPFHTEKKHLKDSQNLVDST